ncbi:MAG: alpha/beta fold hydrolase [Actinomycetota bacterium]
MIAAPEGAAVRPLRLLAGGLHSPGLEAGPPEAREAVVFVHGNPGSSADWEGLVAQVGIFARAVAVDMPGFGQADKPRAGFEYTVQGYASQLEAMLLELGIDRAHLVLHDFGGPWGLAWATQHPGAFASAVLINTGILPGYRWHYLARIWRTPLVGELFLASSSRPAFGLLLRHGNAGGLPKQFLDRMYRDMDRGTKRAILALYRDTGDPSGASAQIAAALAPLHRPALVVWGVHDPYIPAAQAQNQEQAFDVEQVVLLPDSGHWPFADHPEAVAEVVIPFLRRMVGAPADVG